MAKLSYSIALNLLTNGVKKGASEVENTFKKMRSSITSVLGRLGVGLGIADIGMQMINAGKDFESGMARVRAVTNASAKDLKMMTDEAKRLGATTKYSASEAAGALENLTRNGLKPAQATAALSKTLQLAQANSIGLAEAADLMTNTMNGFQMKVSELGKVNDMLSATAANSATNVLEEGEAMTNAAPLANNLKIGIQETSAAIGTLANVGIKGADAGTGLRQFFMGLSTETPEATKALKAYGLQINQSTVAADGLQKTLAKMSASGIGKDNNALAAVFGRRAFASAASLINNYHKFAILNKELGSASGTTGRMFEQSIGKMDEALATLRSTWESFLIEVFDDGGGMFVSPIKGLTEFVRYAKDNLSKLVIEIVGIFAAGKLVKIWNGIAAGARNAFVISVAEAAKANAKIAALQKERVVLEQQMAKLRIKTEQSTGDAKIIYEQEYELKKRQLQEQGLAFEKAMGERSTLAENARRTGSLTGWRAYWAQMKAGFATLGGVMRSIWSTIGPAVVLTLVTEIIFKIVSLAKEAKAVRDMAKDYNSELKKATHTKEITELENLKSVYNSVKNNSKERLKLEGKISSVIGQHVSGMKQVNDVLSKRIKLLKNAAEAEFYTNKSISTADEMRDIESKYGGNPNRLKYGNNLQEWTNNHSFIGRLNPFIGSGIANDMSRYNELRRQHVDASSRLRNAIRNQPISDVTGVEEGAGPSKSFETKAGKKDKAEEELNSQRQSYAESLAKLKIQSDRGYITQSEYGTKVRDLTRSAYIDTQTSKYKSVKESAFADYLSKKLQNQPSDSELNYTASVENFKKEMQKNTAMLDNGAMTYDDYVDAMYQLIDETIKQVSSTENLTDKQKAYIESIKNMRPLPATTVTAKNKMGELDLPSQRSDTDKAQEAFDEAKQHYDDLKSQAEQYGDTLDGAIDDALKNAQKLGTALKLEKAKDALKEFRKNLKDNAFGAIDDLGQLKSSWTNLGETLSDADTDGVDKVFAVFSTLEDTVNGILEFIDAIGAIGKAMKGMSEASAAASEATVAANSAESASTVEKATTDVAANTADAASSAAAGAAKLPFPASLIAVGAAIAGVLALMAAIPKFASGGVVSGTTSFGDMNLARVNSGEMILNGTQQKNLFNAINNDKLGGGNAGGNVSFEIKGDRLVGVLRNRNNKMNKVK